MIETMQKPDAETVLISNVAPWIRAARWGALGMVVWSVSLQAYAGAVVPPVAVLGVVFAVLAFFLDGGLEGVWFVMLGSMISRTEWLSSRIAKACYVAGAGFLMAVPGSVFGPDHPIVVLGGVLSFVGFILWVVWTRGELKAG